MLKLNRKQKACIPYIIMGIILYFSGLFMLYSTFDFFLKDIFGLGSFIVGSFVMIIFGKMFYDLRKETEV